jgi:hypothetical protein
MISLKRTLKSPLLLWLAAGFLLLISLNGVEVTAQSVPSGEQTGTMPAGSSPPPPSAPNIPTKDLDLGGETLTLSPVPTDPTNPPANITISPSPHTHSFPLDDHRPPVTDGFSINLTIPIGPKP